MKTDWPIITVLVFATLTTGCGAPTDPPAAEPPKVADAAGATTLPAGAFMASIAPHCGQAFEGRITVDEPPTDNDPFTGKRLVMHVRECGDGEVRIPFHVGDDHSRTWILTHTPSGLRLKHDHRHEDGTDDAITMYGGETSGAGTAQRQEFPVDAYSIGMFEREGLAASLTNVWAMEIKPGQQFVYELARPGGRLFRVEFDLTRAVETPPTPWGHPDLNQNQDL